MKGDTDRLRIRGAFQRPAYFPVKVTSEGFETQSGFFRELKGRIIKSTLVRRLFEDGIPVCSSPDGIRAENGTLCDRCRHPLCQPRLRIQLAAGPAIYVIDLPPTSAHNLFLLEDEADARRERLVNWTLKLSVLGHDHWGEVLFERTDPPAPERP